MEFCIRFKFEIEALVSPRALRPEFSLGLEGLTGPHDHYGLFAGPIHYSISKILLVA